MEPRMLWAVTALLLLASGGSNAAEDDSPLSPSVFVTAERFGDRLQGMPFADTAGRLWAMTPVSLLKWDGQARSWERTPVEDSPRPKWSARKAGPWITWMSWPIVVPGRQGALLAVVVSDVYQLIPEEKEDSEGNWRRIYQQGDQLAAKRGRYFWLEAWLYRDGKWSERTSLADLLKTEQAYFVRDFTEPTPSTQFFDLQVVANELWWTDGPDVHVLDPTGKMASWRPPKGHPQNDLSQAHGANLVLLADGTLWYVVAGSVTLKLVEGAIEAKPQPGTAYSSRHRNIRVARDGRIWIYGDTNSRVRPMFLREGEWAYDQRFGPFAFEDPDGGMWFMPGAGEGTHSAKGYNILKGGERFRLPLPGPFYKGVVTAAGKDTLLAAGGDRILTIVRSEEEPGWAVRGVLGVRDASAAGPVWLDGHGNLVSIGWSAKLPDGKLP